MKKFTLKDILSSAAKWEPPEKQKRESEKKEIPKKPSAKSNPKRMESIDYDKEFTKNFDILSRTRNRLEIWQDFVVLFACTTSNTVDKSHYDIREKRYLNTIKKYSKKEAEIFPELANIVIRALSDNPKQDYLGHLFMNMNLGNEHNGQFFTPYSVCEMMAKITCTSIDEFCKVHTVSDPACGAGALLIAAFHEFQEQYQKKSLNAQNYILMSAQDIDETVGLMCYIQLSMLGIAGIVKIGNSLTEPMCSEDNNENYWYTPMYFFPIWRYRRLFKEIDNLMNEQSKKEAQREATNRKNLHEPGRLSL